MKALTKISIGFLALVALHYGSHLVLVRMWQVELTKAKCLL